MESTLSTSSTAVFWVRIVPTLTGDKWIAPYSVYEGKAASTTRTNGGIFTERIYMPTNRIAQIRERWDSGKPVGPKQVESDVSWLLGEVERLEKLARQLHGEL